MIESLMNQSDNLFSQIDMANKRSITKSKERKRCAHPGWFQKPEDAVAIHQEGIVKEDWHTNTVHAYASPRNNLCLMIITVR